MIDRIFDEIYRCLPSSLQRHKEETKRVVRFIIIGGLTFVCNAALYAALSRLLWPQGDRSVQNFVATVITSILNYLAHRSWTFRSRGAHAAQLTRYVLVAISAICLQSFLFWIGYEILRAHDFVVIFVVALLIPFYTYFAHKLFTFRISRVIS